MSRLLPHNASDNERYNDNQSAQEIQEEMELVPIRTSDTIRGSGGGDRGNNDEEENSFFQDFIDDDGNDESPSSSPTTTQNGRRHRITKKRRHSVWFMMTMILSLAMIIVAVLYLLVFPMKNNDKTMKSDSGDDGTEKNNTNNDNRPSSSSSSSSFSLPLHAPLSVMDPIHDLGVRKGLRPKETSPSSRLSPLLSRQQQQKQRRALPTNAWYQNLLMIPDQQSPSSEQHRQQQQPSAHSHLVYSIPYILDVAGTIPGLRVHNFRMFSTANTAQLMHDPSFALTLGATKDFTIDQQQEQDDTKWYTVQAATELGVTLQWDYYNMTSSIVRGMPYATMIYNKVPSVSKNIIGTDNSNKNDNTVILPTIFSSLQRTGPLLIDKEYTDTNNDDTSNTTTTTTMTIEENDCSKYNMNNDSFFLVQHTMELSFVNDLTWMIFVSQPVYMQCNDENGQFLLQIISKKEDDENDNNEEKSDDDDSIIVRVALVSVPPIYLEEEEDMVDNVNDDEGTTANIMENLDKKEEWEHEYKHILHKHSWYYPGRTSRVRYNVDISTNNDDIDDDDNNEKHKSNKNNNKYFQEQKNATLIFDWDATSFKHVDNQQDDKNNIENDENDDGDKMSTLITFALPHHQEHVNLIKRQTLREHDNNDQRQRQHYFCTTSMAGPICLARGEIWIMDDSIENNDDSNDKNDESENQHMQQQRHQQQERFLLPTNDISFRAPRPPRVQDLFDLTNALFGKQEEGELISFSIPGNYQNAAGDTYFSGKLLAKLSRMLLLADEIHDLCFHTIQQSTSSSTSSSVHDDNDDDGDYTSVCQQIIPNVFSKTEYDMYFDKKLNELKTSVQIWWSNNNNMNTNNNNNDGDGNGNGGTSFIYDESWGGLISCGCIFDESTSRCTNVYPDCPGVTDPLLNFGNGFYNDHHFHYGYHIYAAATVAYFDPDWGRKEFENVLLYIRDIANPSSVSMYDDKNDDDNNQYREYDEYFPTVRHKDWYRGSSWAGGITFPSFQHGRNQESSSEAIAAYEAVALFGKTMRGAFLSDGHKNETKAAICDNIYKVGLLLTGTEITSAKYYWHVKRNRKDTSTSLPSSSHDQQQKEQQLQVQVTRRRDRVREVIYPIEYQHGVVGILWSTMADFTTWFGTDHFLIYGIQLLPLTPISEERDDDVEWARQMFIPFAKSCNNDCVASGWSIQVLAMLATVGHIDLALEQTVLLPSYVFGTAGGNGHSRSNTIWYLSTRPTPSDGKGPLDLNGTDLFPPPGEGPSGYSFDCYQSTFCTGDILNALAGEYSCGDRITWLINEVGKSEWDACLQVSSTEFPLECGLCNPTGRPSDDDSNENVNEGEDEDDSLDCHQPSACTATVLDTMAENYSCRDRIIWLIESEGLSQGDACLQVAVKEYPLECGPCNPAG